MQPMKLTRKAIRDGLDQMPIEGVLLGAAGAKAVKLTAKQKAFARELALGETKTGAYRKAYNSKGSPKSAHSNAAKLAKDDRIATYTAAINRALEVQRLQTPAQLRALVVSELTKHAIDEDLPAAQRLRALQLLGTVTEVAAFTERREVIKTTNSQEARAQLMESLMLAIKQGATDVDDSAAASLLAELNAGSDAETIEGEVIETGNSVSPQESGRGNSVSPCEGQGIESGSGETPPAPTPPNAERDSGGDYA